MSDRISIIFSLRQRRQRQGMEHVYPQTSSTISNLNLLFSSSLVYFMLFLAATLVPNVRCSIYLNFIPIYACLKFSAVCSQGLSLCTLSMEQPYAMLASHFQGSRHQHQIALSRYNSSNPVH